MVSWKILVVCGKKISRRAVRLERPNGSRWAWFSIRNLMPSPYSGKNACSPVASRSSGRSQRCRQPTTSKTPSPTPKWPEPGTSEK